MSLSKEFQAELDAYLNDDGTGDNAVLNPRPWLTGLNAEQLAVATCEDPIATVVGAALFCLRSALGTKWAVAMASLWLAARAHVARRLPTCGAPSADGRRAVLPRVGFCRDGLAR